MRNRNRRKSVFIDRKAQGRIVFRCSAHWIIFTLATGLITFGMQYCMDPFGSKEAVLTRTAISFGPMLIAMICFMPAFVHDYLSLSHRMLGPITRIRKELQALAAGRPAERMSARENDLLKDMIADLNCLIDMHEKSNLGSQLGEQCGSSNEISPRESETLRKLDECVAEANKAATENSASSEDSESDSAESKDSNSKLEPQH